MSLKGPRRWREQRWLVDDTIRNLSIEWDQPRLGYTLGPVVGDGSPLPTVIAVGGMDAAREIIVAREGDGYLARGFAVLAVDGPGQGEAPIHGVYVNATNWVDAGNAIVEWCRTRPEIDVDRMVCTGTSFGSFWITQIAATQPLLKGCAAALAVFEPGAGTIFGEASPTFKARHMFMAGLYDDEAAFDRMVQGYDLTKLIGGMSAPWLVVAGEADELSPVGWVYELARMCPTPSNLLIYQGARHALTESTAPSLGPGWRASIADWLLDRVNGVPASDDFRYVTVTGAVEQRPHPR